MADYITIRGKQYRVEASMGALEAFMEAVGVDDLHAVDLSKPRNQMIMLAVCLAAGEEMDGRVDEDIVTLVRSLHMGEYREVFDQFIKIYARQSSPQTGASEEGKKK